MIDYWDIHQAAKELRLSVSRTRVILKQNLPPSAIKTDNYRLYYNKEAVESYIKIRLKDYKK